QFLEKGICIPQNLIVIGTVNMDETTFSFSRKVLDRAMTIEMNEVDLRSGLDYKYERIGRLSNNELVADTVEGVDVYDDNQDVCDIALDYLQAVNTELKGTPFKIAYRTRNEFLLYVVNNLPYNKDADGNDVLQVKVIARALDEITSMKILSRIEGDETKVSSAFLDKLSTTIKVGLQTIDADIKLEDSVSLAKLEEMKTRLNLGYTSFWS
ncbi:MAG: McrB family protein, partial [Phocaeicola sp.]